MGLIGNNFRHNFSAHRTMGTVNAMTPGNFARYSAMCINRSQSGNSIVYAGTALPSGGYAPNTYMPPQEAGEMSIRNTGLGSLVANLFPSRSMAINFTGSGDLDATAALVVSMAIAMTGSSNFSATINGRSNMAVNFTGSGDLDATIAALGNMAIGLVGSGDLDATIAAYGNMEIDIVVTGTGLSTANVGQYVWTAILNQFDEDPNSAAAKLLSASSAGDPWGTTIPGAYPSGSAGYILGNLLANIPDAVWDEVLATHGISGSAAVELKKKLSTINFLALKD